LMFRPYAVNRKLASTALSPTTFQMSSKLAWVQDSWYGARKLLRDKG
jgi:hypothetical protein